MKVFNYENYRAYLLDELGGANKRNGEKRRLADHLQCQPSHITQVLAGRNNLSLEHAIRASTFFAHSSLETEYFLALVQLDSAGTKELREHLKKDCAEKLKKATNLEERIKSSTSKVSEMNQNSIYYSDKVYALVHVAVSLPQVNTINDLKALLNIDEIKISRALSFLKDQQIVATNNDGNLTTGPGHTFLNKSSIYINSHHQNLRRHASSTIDSQVSDENLHYSTYFTVSKEKYQKIRASITDLIANNLNEIDDSEPEVVACFVTDLFQVK